MFIKNIDYLSPPITFYYQGSLSHTSIVSGILSIISIIFILILTIYFSLELIQRKEPNAFYFSSYIEDAGIIPLNSSSLFHFITIATVSNGYSNGGVDFTNFRIIGYENYFENYLYDRNISHFDHWLYGKCNNESDTIGISYLIKYDFFENSACIRKYFSFEEQKYYDVGEEKFRWPQIAHGTFNEKLKLYSIFLENCNEETINLILGKGHHCKSDIEIDESFNNLRIANFYFINHYINVLNYDNPNIKFFYRIETGMFQNQYTINHLNFNPSRIKTHNGLILDNIEQEDSYAFDRNDNYIEENDGNKLYLGYCFWLKNTKHYYERNYKRIQDIISNIGGIYQIITILSIYLNKLYNNYVLLNDIEKLLFNNIYQEKNIVKENIIHKNAMNKNNIKDEKVKLEKDKLNKDDENKKYKERKNAIDNYESKMSNMHLYNTVNNNNTKYNHKSISEQNIKDKKLIYDKNKNFLDFIKYKLICIKSNNNFHIYYNIRIKILSEEHLIRNHLNIYNLLKMANKKRNFRRNSYQLKDLIELI